MRLDALSGLSTNSGSSSPCACALHTQPHPQGIKWIKSREASSGLVILQQSQPKYVDKVLQCIEQVRGEAALRALGAGQQSGPNAPNQQKASPAAPCARAASPHPPSICSFSCPGRATAA